MKIMTQSKEIEEKKGIVRKKVGVTESLLLIPYGETRRYRAASFAPHASVRAIVSRLNRTGKGTYTLTTDDNGVTYSVTRK